MIELGRELEARRAASPWLWLSTQEQIALARLGKALLVSQTKLVSGTLTSDGANEAIAASKGFSRELDYAALAKGLRFLPQGEGPYYASLDVAGVPRTAPAAAASPGTQTASARGRAGAERIRGTGRYQSLRALPAIWRWVT